MLSNGWAWVFAAQLAAMVGFFVLLKVVASTSSVGEFGRFALVLATAAGVTAFLFGPLAAAAQRHYQQAQEEGALAPYYRAVAVGLLACTLLALVLPSVALVVAPDLPHRIGLTPALVRVGLVLGVVSGISDVGVAIANAALHRGLAALFLVAGAWLRVVGVMAAYAIGLQSASGYALMGAIGLAALLPLQCWTIRLRLRSDSDTAPSESRPHTSYVRALWRYAAPFVVWALPGYLIIFGDRFLLAHFSGPGAVGLYAAMTAATISVVGALGAAVNRVLEPTLYAETGGGTDPRRVNRGTGLIRLSTLGIVLAAAPAVLLYILAPAWVISLFTSSSYVSSAPYLWILLVAGVVFFAGQQLTLHGMVVKRPWVYVPIKFLHACVLIVACLLLIPPFGIAGIVFAVLGAHLVWLGLVALTNRYRLPATAEVL